MSTAEAEERNITSYVMEHHSDEATAREGDVRRHLQIFSLYDTYQ